MINYLLVALGGALGSISRYALSQYVTYQLFPLKTLLANLLGCLIIGFVMGRSAQMDSRYVLLLTTGFCGGFTTLSTFSYEVLQLAQNGKLATAFVYGGGTLLLALVAVLLGLTLATK